MGIKKQIMDKKIECHKCWIETDRKEVKVFGPKIEIDVCPKCKGIWLDRGELHKLLKDRKLANYLTKHIGTQSKSEMVCPRCGGLMDIEKAEDIELDVCLTCNGIWLDEGELEALKLKVKEGYEGDPLEKAIERAEEEEAKTRGKKRR